MPYLRIIVVFVSLSLTFSAAMKQYSFPSVFQPFPRVDDDWDLNRPLTMNTTANLVFATAISLLQSFPNLRYRNGHTIVPGIVHSGTLLYHGRGDSSIPTTEWVAFDPEPAHEFCRVFGMRLGNCWLHTFAVDRPLHVLYFDGSSAAKIGDGAMDSQDVITWNAIRPDRVREEGQRIQTLCEWGEPFGLDGFVRTASISEIMLCNFSSVKLVSSQNLKAAPFKTVPPDLSPTPTVVPAMPIPINSHSITILRIIERFTRYPGLTHIHLDLTHLVSFYDEELAPSLIDVRSGKPRLEHRLLGIAQEDIVRVKKHLEEQISETRWSSLENPHFDWRTHMHYIVDLYGDPLEDIWNLLNSTTSVVQTTTAQVFRVVESLIGRFVLSSVSPPPTHSNLSSAVRRGKSDVAWASSVFRECTLSHYLVINSLQATNSERLLRNAVETTTREVCRVLTQMWVDGVHDGLSDMFDDNHPHDSNKADPGALLNVWRNDLQKLMKWLDWDVWLKCKPVCTEHEQCYISAWPFVVGNVSGPVWREDNPRPRCLRKFEPFVYADDIENIEFK